MARGNVQIIDASVKHNVSTHPFKTEAGATDINIGEPVKLKEVGSSYVIPLADAEPVIGTTTAVAGIAAGDSQHTASVDGDLEVYIPLPGVIYQASPKSAAAIDTQAEIDALVGKRVLFDLTSGVFTVDTATVDGANNGVIIVGGDLEKGVVHFYIREGATLIN